MRKIVTYAFVDGQNLHLGIKSCGWELDYKKFRTYLREKYGVEKAFLFLGYLGRYKKLYSKLENDGFILVFKKITRGKNRKIKGNVDAEIVLYACAKEYDNYDRAIIISGDGDFYCLISFLIENKKFSRLLVPNRKSMSKLLWEFSSITDYLEKLKSKIGE